MTDMAPSEIRISEFSVGDMIDGRWSVDAILGEGTFGKVYRVKDLQEEGKEYALKLLKLWIVPATERKTILSRFDREFETGLIPSDYLVHSHFKGEAGGNPYIVMDYFAYGDLKKAVVAHDVNLTMVLRHVLLGLRDLHRSGRVHRDLKPENVLLTDLSHAALTDFGIAGDQNNRLTMRGVSGVPTQRFGTMAYMPPEQANPRGANATVLPTTDLFSFGVMVYRLLTGCLPFGKLASPADIVPYTKKAAAGDWNRQAVIAANPEGFKWLHILEATLQPDFSRRVQTAEEVIDMLPGDVGSMTDPSFCDNFPTDLSAGLALRITQGSGQGTLFNLSELMGHSMVATIGRKSDSVCNTLSIGGEDSGYMSRQQCSIQRDPLSGEWTIRDGQYRVQCAIALRHQELFPCSRCTAVCAESGRRMRWKSSLNGTFLNSIELDHNLHPLQAGDIISIGEIKLRVEGV